MVQKELDLRTTDYQVQSLKIMIGEDVKDIEPSKITRFAVFKNYDESIMPVIAISVSLDDYFYAKMIQHRLKLKFHLRVRKLHAVNRNEKKEEWFNSLLVTYLDSAQPFLDEKLSDISKRVSGTINEDGSDSSKENANVYEFFLFDHKTSVATRKLINNVFTGTNITDVVAACLTNIGAKNVLMQKLDNSTSYSEVILQPVTIIGALQTLDSMFGLYKQPHLIFFDIGRTYLVPKTTKIKARIEKEPTKVVLTVKDHVDESSQTGGYYLNNDDNAYEMNINPDDIIVSTASIINDMIDANGRYLMSPNSKKLITVKPDTEQIGSSPTMRMQTLKYTKNEYIASHVKSSLEETSRIVRLMIGSVDSELFKPNSECHLRFQNSAVNKEYGGIYRVKSVILQTMKMVDKYRPSVTIELVQ